MMSLKPDQIEELFKRYERGLCTPEEEKLLEDWLDSPTEAGNPFKSALEEQRIKAKLKAAIYNSAGLSSEIHRAERGRNMMPFRIAAAIGALAIAVTAALWLLNPAGNRELATSNPGTLSPARLTGNYSGKQFVQLPDGTAITMNAGSELSYDFRKNARTVNLKGEAFFDVAHDKTKPFRIYTADIITEVLGTAFNINANEKNITVTVTRGKVQVGDKDRVYQQLIPEQQLSINTADHTFVTNVKETESAVRWKREYFIFDRVPMFRAAELIAEQFDVDVVIDNETIANCPVSGRFINRESLEEVLTLFSTAHETTFEIKGKQVIIKGGVSCEETH